MRYLLPAAGFVSTVFFAVLAQAAAPGNTVLPHAPVLARQDRSAPRLAAASGTAALQWSWAEPTPSGDQLEAVAYGSGTFVAVGTDGVVYTSTDATHWSVQQSGLPIGETLRDVIFAQGQFMATHVGASGKTDVLTSSDGKSWDIETPSGQSGNALASQLAYANGDYVIIGVKALVSSDGKHWSEHSIASGTQIAGMPVYANGRFVINALNSAGDPAIYYSSDGGSTWNLAATTFANPDFLTYLASDGSGFVLVGDDVPACNNGSVPCGLVYTSSDGSTWTQQADAANSGGFNAAIIWDGTQYLTVSTDSSTNIQYVYSSPDGITWTQGSSANIHSLNSPHLVAFGGGQYVFVGPEDMTVLTSTDFAAWTLGTTGSGPQVDFTDVEYLNSAYYAAGYAPNGITIIMRSTDAETWTTVYSASPASDVGIDTLAYGGGVYVGLGDPGKGVTSSDGVHWTRMSTPPAGEYSQVVYGAGKFVAVGAACGSGCFARVETSSDGKTWTDQSLVGNNAPLQAVVFDGKQFVGIGTNVNSSGSGITGYPVSIISSDGVNWGVETIAPPSGYTFTHLRAINGKYYAVGYNPSFFDGYLAVSTDGLHWTDTYPDINGRAPAVSDIGWLNGAFYMTSQGFTQVLTSTDASHWSYTGNFFSTPYLQALTVQNDSIVAVGSLGGVGFLPGVIVVGSGAPVASDGSLNASENTAATGILTGAVGIGGTPAFSVATGPTHGTVKLTDAKTGAFTYTPAANYTGTDSFTFAVSDGTQQSAAATESITVAASSGGNSGSGGGGFGGLSIGVLLAAEVLRRRRRMTC